MIITSISGFFPWIEDQWKGLYLYLFILAKGIFRSLHLENGKHSSVRESVKKNELWWVLVSPEVGLATSPLH